MSEIWPSLHWDSQRDHLESSEHEYFGFSQALISAMRRDRLTSEVRLAETAFQKKLGMDVWGLPMRRHPQKCDRLASVGPLQPAQSGVRNSGEGIRLWAHFCRASAAAGSIWERRSATSWAESPTIVTCPTFRFIETPFLPYQCTVAPAKSLAT